MQEEFFDHQPKGFPLLSERRRALGEVVRRLIRLDAALLMLLVAYYLAFPRYSFVVWLGLLSIAGSIAYVVFLVLEIAILGLTYRRIGKYENKYPGFHSKSDFAIRLLRFIGTLPYKLISAVLGRDKESR